MSGKSGFEPLQARTLLYSCVVKKSSGPQHTLAAPVQLEGVGLHSGKPARVRLFPAPAGHGIQFVRTDNIPAPVEIPATYAHVVNTRLATTLGNRGVTLSTVEHLLAALAGLGVDNARIEVDGPEMPILDGSSAPFIQAIQQAGGTVSQSLQRVTLALRRKVEVQLGDKWAVAEPSSRLEIHGSIEWDHPMIGRQEYHYVDGVTPFAAIADSRTFCQLKDVEAMQRMGLALGGTLENAVVLSEDGILNPGGLRHPDELVRHKVLDALGDFKLSGYAIQGYFRLHRSGHDVHSQLLKAIFAQPENYEIIGSSVGSASAGTQSVGSSAGRVGVSSATGRLAAAF